MREAFGLSASFNAFLSAPAGTILTDNTKLVKIAIGTGGQGHCYPGATFPFRAAQLSLDSGIKDSDHCYHYNEDSILGFRHTHPSGTGCDSAA